MAQFKFVGDPRPLGAEKVTGHGPERLVLFGITFIKNAITEVEDEAKAILAKLRGNTHFQEVKAPGEIAPGLKETIVDAVKEVAPVVEPTADPGSEVVLDMIKSSAPQPEAAADDQAAEQAAAIAQANAGH